MRTAQRYGLARASTKVVAARSTRAWSPADVLLTYTAEELDRSLAIPFEVATQILCCMPDDAIAAIQSPDVFFEELVAAVPLVCLYDRRQFTLRRENETLIGELVRDSVSRKNVFAPLKHQVIQAPASNAYAESCLGNPVSIFKQRNLKALFAGSA